MPRGHTKDEEETEPLTLEMRTSSGGDQSRARGGRYVSCDVMLDQRLHE